MGDSCDAELRSAANSADAPGGRAAATRPVVARVVAEVVEQHAGEAAFLWELRELSSRAQNYTLRDLIELDWRIDAHLEGLRVAGEAGWAICAGALDWHDPGETFVALLRALERGNVAEVERVVGAIDWVHCQDAVVAALGWLDSDVVAPWLETFSQQSAPSGLRAAAIAGYAAHQIDPGARLDDAICDNDESVRARAMRAVGELGRLDRRGSLRGSATDDAHDVRLWAAWSDALLGGQGLELASFTADERATAMAAHCDAAPWLDQLGPGRPAIAAAAASGRTIWIDRLIEWMSDDEYARAAAAAFHTISGIPVRDALERSAPTPLSGPSDDPKDDDVALDLDEALSWPDPAAIAACWASAAARFDTNRRYLLGRPIDDAWLHQVLRRGEQPQRALAAIELARRGAHPLFQTRAPGFRQERQLR